MTRRVILSLLCVLVTATGCGDSDDPGAASNNGTTSTNSGTTGTNNGTTSTNSGTSSTNSGTTSTNSGTTSTNNSTTSTNNGTTGTNNGTTSTNNGTTSTNNGTTTPPDVCDPNPCTEAPEDECLDGTTALIYDPLGECFDDGNGEAVCGYTGDEVDCAATGQVCEVGACVDRLNRPGPGDVIVTEIMYDPGFGLEDSDAEWFEVTNVSAAAVALTGCVVEDDGGNSSPIEALELEAGATALFARSDVPAENGGLTPDAGFTFALGNGGDAVSIVCGDVIIDTVAYDGGEAFPDAQAASLSLNPDAYNAGANDDGANWCLGVDAYFGGANPDEDNLGTPGAPNPVCEGPDTTVDWCRLQFPVDAEVPAGSEVLVYGRVFEEGITDRTSGTDPDPNLIAEVGFGPDGSDPNDNDAWTWVAAEPNPGYDDTSGFGEPGNDEYQAAFTAPVAGTYAHAYRFSIDDGATWLYCDRDAGEGSDGAQDGYQTENAGSLVTLPSVCDPNPCTEAPADACEGSVAITYADTGACTPDGAEFTCDYAATSVDCADLGGTCDAGACVGGARAAQAEEVIITEIMYNPHFDLSDDSAEWVELHNVTDVDLLIQGCSLDDSANSEALDTFVVPAGGFALLVKSDVDNGGLVPDAVFGLALGNGGDTVSIVCDGVIIDAVTYDDTFPSAQAASLSLNPDAFDAMSNDLGANWCLGVDTYFGGANPDEDNLGTPGAPNPVCAAPDACTINPCTEPPSDACEGDVALVYDAPLGACEVGPDDAAVCTYTPTEIDCALGGGTCEAGVCVGGAPRPGPGEVVITEIMYDPHFALSDATAEWFEVTNVSDAVVDLGGCTVSDDGGNSDVVTPLALNPGDYALFAASDADNGGLVPDAFFGFGLGNGGDTITITCDDAVVDAVAYDDAPPWVDARAASLSLNPDSIDADANDDGASWCLGADAYFGGANPDEDNLGTPGAPNPPCPVLDTVVDFCRLQFPVTAEVAVGESVTVFGRVYEEGITDRTSGTDPDPSLIAEVGFGPDGSDPDGNDAWAWVAATPNAGYDDSSGLGEPNNDEYQATFLAPAEGVYDHAYRFSRDGGVTWLYCDSGDAGSSDGYQIDNAGSLTTLGNPTFRQPVAGEVVITEIMYDPNGELTEEDAEWFEVFNTTDEPLDLAGCSVEDSANSAPVPALVIEPGAYAVFGKSLDPLANGGIDVDALFPFGLNNGGDTVRIACDAGVVDEVVYDDQAPWVDASSASLNLDPELIDADLNDLGDAWCLATSAYYSGDPAHLGTPGAPNTACEVPAVCEPNPCTEPPADVCADATNVAAYQAVGACSEGPDGAVCDYDFDFIDCAEGGQVCEGGVCVDPVGARQPVAGEVVITEIMYDPNDPLAEGRAEWFEVFNATDEPLDLAGCSVEDAANSEPLAGLLILPGAYAVFAQSDTPDVNGGIVADALFTFGLNNGGDTVRLTCDAGVVDEVIYDDQAPWVDASAASLNLDPELIDADLNDLGDAWCLATNAYYNAGTPHFGTPGAPNSPCAPLDTVVDFCRLQFPVTAEVEAGTDVTVFGRVYEEGITDQSPATDADPRLIAEVGFGPDGTNPAGNDAWAWVAATPNAGYNGNDAGEPNNDEYQATFTAPAAGTYDHAYRFSLDGGQSWLYCDGGDAGSSDGYQIDSAGSLTTTDGGGEDPVSSELLLAGDLVFTEVMYDPHFDLSDAEAEWFEVHNTTGLPVDLTGCTVSNPTITDSLDGLVIPADGYMVFGKVLDPALTGGFVPDALFTFPLANGGTTLTITCPNGPIDVLTYDDAAPFPVDLRARSINLDPELIDADLNDLGDAWCEATNLYYSGLNGPDEDHFGTPGAPNTPCP